MTEDHHRVHGAECFEHFKHLVSHRGVRDADELARRPGRIHQRADEVEGRRDTELTAHRRRGAHRRVKARRKAEADPGLVDAPSHPAGAEVDDHAEGFEHVGRACKRRSRTPTVLADDSTCTGDHEGAERGDIDRAATVPSRAAGVHDLDSDLEALAVSPHRSHKAGHLLDRLALGSQASDESGDLGRGRVAFEHVVEGCGSLVRGEILPAQNSSEDRRPSAHALQSGRRGPDPPKGRLRRRGQLFGEVGVHPGRLP